MKPCPKCKVELDDYAFRCKGCGHELTKAELYPSADPFHEKGNIPSEASLPSSEKPTLASSIIAKKLSGRYSDAYTEAHAVVSVGEIVKGIGVGLAIIIFIGGFVASNEGRDTITLGIGFVLACLVAIPIYILGILVAAQGQTQLATLDTAVNSSRHLQDDDVAKILSKRFSL